MIRPRFIVAFSGHRALGDPEGVRQRIREELEQVRALVDSSFGGVLEFYGSVAYGSDTLAVEVCRDLQIPAHLILPKPLVYRDAEIDRHRGFAADFWEEDEQGQRTFREADWGRSLQQIEDARRGAGGGTLRLVEGSHTAPDCYYDAGLRTLDACDLLLAVWDGKPAAGLGGTGDMVEYALHRGLPLVVMPAAGSGATTREPPELFPGSEDEGVAMMAEVDQFCDEEGCRAALPEGEEMSPDALFEELEDCSEKNSKEFRDSLVKIILFHGSATLVAAAAAILPQLSWQWKIVLAALAGIEACLVLWAFLRARRLHQSKTHEGWMRSRFAGEIMRGLRDSHGLLDPLHPLVARHRPEWRRFAMSAALQIRRSEQAIDDWRVARDHYVDIRLRHPDITKGQIRYFTDHQKVARRRFDRARARGSLLGLLAVIFVSGAVVYKISLVWQKMHTGTAIDALANTYGDQLLPWIYDFLFKLLPIALPLLAGIAISLRIALDSGRRTYRYKELATLLEDTAGQLQVMKSESAVRRKVTATEEVLLDEIIEWHLAEQQNGAH